MVMVSRSHRPLRRGLRITLLALALPTIASGIALLTNAKGARADGAEADKAEASERCAIRIAIALEGKSADAALLANPDPQGAIDGMLASPAFAGGIVTASMTTRVVSHQRKSPQVYGLRRLL